MNAQIKLYKDCIDVLDALSCCVKISEAVRLIKDSKGELSTSLSGGGTVWEKNTTLKYNNVSGSKIGDLKDWKGRFNNGIFSITKKNTDISYSIPISELQRINREEKIRKQLEQMKRKQVSPYASGSSNLNNLDISSLDRSLVQPQQNLYESTRNLASLVTSIAGVIGALSMMKNSVFAVKGKEVLSKLFSSKKSIESANKDIAKAREILREIN